jgi:hypothetical protein
VIVKMVSDANVSGVVKVLSDYKVLCDFIVL